jgi:hypothetical protein
MNQDDIRETISALRNADGDLTGKVAIVGGWEGGIPGSVRDLCGCGAVIYLSPDSQRVIEKVGHDAVVMMCINCFRAEIEREGLENVNIFAPGEVM